MLTDWIRSFPLRYNISIEFLIILFYVL